MHSTMLIEIQSENDTSKLLEESMVRCFLLPGWISISRDGSFLVQ